MVQTLNESEFRSAVLESASKAVVDFWAPWCAPCRVMLKTVKEVASGYDGVTFATVNIDDNPDLAVRHGITGIPTVVFYNDGREVGRLTGVQPPAAVRRFLDAL
jgi:thioredoxin 1